MCVLCVCVCACVCVCCVCVLCVCVVCVVYVCVCCVCVLQVPKLLGAEDIDIFVVEFGLAGVAPGMEGLVEVRVWVRERPRGRGVWVRERPRGR